MRRIAAARTFRPSLRTSLPFRRRLWGTPSRAFREFSGVPSAEYLLRRGTTQPQHMPLPACGTNLLASGARFSGRWLASDLRFTQLSRDAESMPKSVPEAQLANAALKLLTKKAWSDLTLGEVAHAARQRLSSMQPIAAGKADLFALILAYFLAETGNRYKSHAKESDTRDRLLDLCLTFFEVLGARKPAIRALYNGICRDPLTLIAARQEITAAANWLLVLAEEDTGSLIQIRALALAGIIARAIPVWLDDEADLSRTMAQLDNDLRRAGFLFRRR